MIKFIVKESLRGIRKKPLSFFLSTFAFGLCLLIILIFFLLTYNLFLSLKVAYDKIEIYAFLDEKVSFPSIKDKISLIDGVEEVKYISKEEALKILKEELKEEASFLEALDRNPLPPSLRIRISPKAKQVSEIKKIEDKLKLIPGIKDVWAGEELISKLIKVLNNIIYIDIGILIIVAISVIFIIFQNIEQSLFNRQREIEIMQLVGAKDYFIKAPFYLEGILEGILGGIFSFIILFIIYRIMSLSITAINFPTSILLIFAIFMGASLGGIGANLALNRILK
ncbi:MAG: permease-like cell division protein FtsX [candidate division WOR-3 bacterium]|nr:permease-like cell division protein FtsX [candidate division WOR-3 bacterium]MCX7836805.1 permease-like cell division protein FtsX [candidate division WOR-3 bacterium]MDW8113878.1 permease-like cell division protein FtsX [candidate division WOR-3 bacterium]